METRSDVVDWYRLDYKILVGIERNPRPKPSRFPIECLLDPFDVLARGTEKSEVLDLQGNQFECVEGSVGWLQVGEIHQHQIITVALITTNPFIVV